VPAAATPLSDHDYEVFWQAVPGLSQMVLEGTAGIAGGSVFNHLTAQEQRARSRAMGESAGPAIWAPWRPADQPGGQHARATSCAEHPGVVIDPETAEALIQRPPDRGHADLRPTSDYYETFNRPTSPLVNLRKTADRAITATGCAPQADTRSTRSSSATGFDR